MHALARHRYTMREQTTLGTGLVRADTNTIVKFFFVFAHFLQRSSERRLRESNAETTAEESVGELALAHTARAIYVA